MSGNLRGFLSTTFFFCFWWTQIMSILLVFRVNLVTDEGEFWLKHDITHIVSCPRVVNLAPKGGLTFCNQTNHISL